MSTLRKIAEIPAGSWTKWVVVGFWLVVLVIALPLSSKLALLVTFPRGEFWPYRPATAR
jgi:hypothetical protein